MKKVFSSHPEICHKFNEQSQYEGRSSNIFFEGDKIYSYGYHYILGQFLTPQMILINDDGYSVSTSKHIGILASATLDKKQIWLNRAEPQRVLNKIKGNLNKLAHARKPLKYVNEIESIYNSFKSSCDELGGVLLFNYYGGKIVKKTKAPKDFKAIIRQIEKIYNGLNTEAQAEELKAIREKKKAQRAEKRERENQQRAEQKRKFYEYETNYLYNRETTLLRISKCGEYVETSQQVRIDLTEAKRYALLLNSGKEMRGEKIAQYITKSFGDLLKIGCHTIEKAEAQRITNLILS